LARFGHKIVWLRFGAPQPMVVEILFPTGTWSMSRDALRANHIHHGAFGLGADREGKKQNGGLRRRQQFLCF
jgi:hypothetical protein